MSFGRGAVTVVPAAVTDPDVALSIPPMMASSVDLPQPEGPSRQTNSPLRISSDTLSSACTFCDASRPAKTIDTPSIAIAVGAAAFARLASATDAAAAAATPAVTSELHRDELIVVDRLGIRDKVEDFEILQGMTDDIKRRHVPCAVGREAADLGVIDLRHDALAHLHDFGARLHREVLVGLHEGDRLEPAAQEPLQQFRSFCDHVIGGQDDMRVEVLL